MPCEAGETALDAESVFFCCCCGVSFEVQGTAAAAAAAGSCQVDGCVGSSKWGVGEVTNIKYKI